MRFVARLHPSALSTNNALIVTAGWTRFGLRHALLATTFAVLILQCELTLVHSCRVPSMAIQEKPASRKPCKTGVQLGEVPGVETSNR